MRLILVLFIPLLAFSSPSWLYKIEHDKKHDIIGYGINENLRVAKKNAIADITNTLHVSVDSSLEIDNTDNNGNVVKKSSTHLRTNSKATLSGVQFIKVEQIQKLWYVAAKYDNSPIDAKLKKLLPDNLVNETQNRYLKNTPLFKMLNKEIGVKLNYKVIRKDSL